MYNHGVLSLLLLLLSVLQLVLSVTTITVDAAESELDKQDGSRGKKHHLLLFMGGLKSIAALVLIKIKIVLAVAAVVAIVMFTIKYLMGYAGLPGLFYKEEHPAPPPPPHHHYLPVVHDVHEPIYGYAAADFPMTAWDDSHQELHGHHEIHDGHEWSKMGTGGRSFLDILNQYPQLEEILMQGFFHHKKKKMKKRDLNSFPAWRK